MNIAIVEDCNSDAITLTSHLTKYQQQHSMELHISRFDSGEAFLSSPFEKFHLIFMDIYMEKMDGIETARRIFEENADCMIIFLTTSKEDIWRAVKVHACFDYVEKCTLDYPRIEELLDTAQKKLRLQAKVLEFFNGKQKVRLPLSKIQYLVSRDKYTFITLEDGQESRYRITFSTICSLLENEPRFLLCNRGILLNMDFIGQANRETFVMKNKEAFPIHKRNHTSIMQRFNDYQFQKLNEEV